MSYTEQTWANGDIITAEKLNHMEDGIAGALSVDLIVRVDVDDGDPTFTVTYGNSADVLSKFAQGKSAIGAVELNIFEEGSVVQSGTYIGKIAKEGSNVRLMASELSPNISSGSFLSLIGTAYNFEISGTTVVDASAENGTAVF